ncbi:hypothetical protein GCM10027610_001050 [Dactylosporangium cerinum]
MTLTWIAWMPARIAALTWSVGTSRQVHAAGAGGDRLGLAAGVHAADVDGHDADVRGVERGDGVGEAVPEARVVRRGVAEDDDDAGAAVAEVHGAVGELEQRVEVVLGQVTAAVGVPQVDPGLDHGLVRGDVLADGERRGVIDVLVLSDTELRVRLRRRDLAHDGCGVGAHVRDRVEHAAGGVGKEHDVRLRRHRRGLDVLGDVGRLAGPERQTDVGRGHTWSGLCGGARRDDGHRPGGQHQAE